jgi:hypothetical protein
MEEKRYPILEEEENVGMVNEPALAIEEEIAMPDQVGYASIIDGVLQITPDIEEEIEEAEQGKVVSMSEFKSMFAKWLD